MGFVVEEDTLRIPSSKRVGLVVGPLQQGGGAWCFIPSSKRVGLGVLSPPARGWGLVFYPLQQEGGACCFIPSSKRVGLASFERFRIRSCQLVAFFGKPSKHALF